MKIDKFLNFSNSSSTNNSHNKEKSSIQNDEIEINSNNGKLSKALLKLGSGNKVNSAAEKKTVKKSSKKVVSQNGGKYSNLITLMGYGSLSIVE